jgi:hypothetical protein
VRKVPDSGEGQARENRKTRFIEQQGTERLRVLTHARVSSCREWFHAATVTRAGGERRRPGSISVYEVDGRVE